jgi:hypothetical protein
MTTPAVNVPDEIVKKVDALVDTATTLEAVSHGDVDVLVSGPEANAEYKAAHADLLATIASHITPALPADEELRDAMAHYANLVKEMYGIAPALAAAYEDAAKIAETQFAAVYNRAGVSIAAAIRARAAIANGERNTATPRQAQEAERE